MILRKYTSLLGIGAAKIDLILSKDIFTQGEEIQGHYLIKGGIVEQYIKRIESQLLRINHMNNEEKIVDSSTIVVEKQIKTDMEETLNFISSISPDLTIPRISDVILLIFPVS